MASYDPVELFPAAGANHVVYSDSKEGEDQTIENESLTDKDYNNHSISTEQSSVYPVVWDVFKSYDLEAEPTPSSTVEYFKILFKLCFTLVLCSLVLLFGFLNKLTLVQIYSHFNTRPQHTSRHCVHILNNTTTTTTIINTTSNSYTEVTYIWALFLCIAMPYVQVLLPLMKRLVFKNTQPIKSKTFLWVLCVESVHSIGLFILTYLVLPQLEVTQLLLVLEGIAILPSFLKLAEQQTCITRVFNCLAIFGQSSILFYWMVFRPLNDRRWYYLNAILPVALIFISVQWWDNYLGSKPSCNLLKKLSTLRRNLQKTRTRTYLIVILWKTLLNFILVVFAIGGENRKCYEILFYRRRIANDCFGGFLNIKNSGYCEEPLITALINLFSSFLCYQCVKIACKILCQIPCFVLPLSLLTPLAVLSLPLIKTDELQWKNVLKTVKWTQTRSWYDYMICNAEKEHILLAIIWLISLLIVANQIFRSKTERLASTEKLFVKPLYCAISLEQSMFLNKRRNDSRFQSAEPRIRNHSQSSTPTPTPESTSAINLASEAEINPRIFVCVTLWHETELEMMKLLKSIFRLDIDQCARRHARQYFQLIDPDYYTFEAHLIMDDAFDSDGHINYFVRQLMGVMDSALSCVHNVGLQMKPPSKYVTPYGGRLEWTLPGGNLLMVHLKDKQKIRSKKRWSQVMYMYWILGYRIMSVEGSVQLKQSIAQNTFLLTLDGDIEFQPPSFLKLLDRMKKHPHVGAASGRIHPVGSGPLIWYQKFEYAISHWLQKSAEHVMGCVLCSPGCFSLIRGSSLMDDNILSTYTSVSCHPIDYLQKDQGEDRWLSTLLLKRGYRVEYCAAADAMTFAPAGFKEFFNQRRRWMPSTLANTYDILSNWRMVVKHNNSISMLYLMYQVALLSISFISPGTIFVLLVSAINRAYPTLSLAMTFFLNLVPIIIMMLLCKYASTDTQLNYSIILTLVYTVVMMTVLTGLSLEIATSLFCSTTTIFATLVILAFLSAALLHPQEFSAIFGGLVFLLAVPTMSIILVIYAMGNLHIVSWGTREVVQQNLTLLSTDSSEVLTPGVSLSAIPHVKSTILKRFQRFIATIRNCYQRPPPASCDTKHQEILFRIEDLEFKLKNLTKLQNCEQPSCSSELRTLPHFGTTATSTTTTTNTKEQASGTTNSKKPWYKDSSLGCSELSQISAQETRFWKEFIDKYLLPLKSNLEVQKQKKSSLEKLRNKLAIFYLMTNMSFIVLVLSLENNSLSNDNLTFSITCNFKDVAYDKVRPLSVMFVVVFGLILSCQMLAMLFHRVSTIIHIVASIDVTSRLPWRKKARTNTLQLIRNMQRLDKEVVSPDSIITTDENTELSNESLPRLENYMSLFKHRRQPDWINCIDNSQQPNTSLGGHFKENFNKINSRTFVKSRSERFLREHRLAGYHSPSLPILKPVPHHIQPNCDHVGLMGPVPHHIQLNQDHVVPVPHHIQPNCDHVGPVPHHIQPNCDHVVPVPHHIQPNCDHVGPVPHHLQPNQDHVGPVPHHIQPNCDHVGPVPHNIQPNCDHVGPVPHNIQPNQAHVRLTIQQVIQEYWTRNPQQAELNESTLFTIVKEVLNNQSQPCHVRPTPPRCTRVQPSAPMSSPADDVGHYGRAISSSSWLAKDVIVSPPNNHETSL
ncbi:chitin synthase chs-2-like [Argonauta hians]